MQVRDVMSTNVQSCSNQDNLSMVASKMQALNIGSLPVVENNQVVGMVTDRDMVVRGLTNGAPNDSIQSVMTNNVITVSSSSSLEEAAQLMSQHQVRRLPVVDNGNLVGMVSLGDLAIREQADQKAGQALTQISKSDLS
ncbi:CBS domain-containing protein [Cytobacillus solani]|uniref:Inosine-5'-monophosphate dehydrogenase n=1 Tax=Cytobacillus solani TaxID=1637975 RepID=A0A0Q3SEB5_9BACI|nr:CBS domain-containing protein [Cytobacillus solani]KOP79594.1 inosine-5'-monophosphate dehydrogenase [Bacillus sp. FJAT-21945]KQL17612.1 inosine-5'-monophosphate dehydrogenase [Cytobacillus solani]USK55476.1 CBS domain-containing protein [Cytobacillus solani]